MSRSGQVRKGVHAAENPLRSELIERIRFRFSDGRGWDFHLERLEAMNFRAAIVGQKGSGKTTLLEQLQRRLNGHYLSLPLERESHESSLVELLQASREGSIILLDGIERLGFWQCQRVFRETKKGSGLIVNVHRPCRLATWVRCKTTPELMDQLLEDLGLASPNVIAAGQVAFLKCQGNVREAFRLLYDQFAIGELENEKKVNG